MYSGQSFFYSRVEYAEIGPIFSACWGCFWMGGFARKFALKIFISSAPNLWDCLHSHSPLRKSARIKRRLCVLFRQIDYVSRARHTQKSRSFVFKHSSQICKTTINYTLDIMYWTALVVLHVCCRHARKMCCLSVFCYFTQLCFSLSSHEFGFITLIISFATVLLLSSWCKIPFGRSTSCCLTSLNSILLVLLYLLCMQLILQ